MVSEPYLSTISDASLIKAILVMVALGAVTCLILYQRLREVKGMPTLGLRLIKGEPRVAPPARCPITQRPFFMVLQHPSRGEVPTYGGPESSYTVPEPAPGHGHLHERPLMAEKFDHIFGRWVEPERVDVCLIDLSTLVDFVDVYRTAVQGQQPVFRLIKNLRAVPPLNERPRT